MKYLLIIFISFSFISISQNDSFPNSYVGNWSGNLEIMGVDSTVMNIGMSLNIQPTKNDSIYTWELTYVVNDSTNDVRLYELVVIDKSKGIYVIDEKNSIVMESYYRNKTFTSFFAVGDNFLIFSYVLSGDDLILDVLYVPKKPVSETGGEIIDNEEIPLVESYLILGRQRAVLTRL